jgi:hypothetical protein
MVHRLTSERPLVGLVVRLNYQNDGFLDFFVAPTPKSFISVDFSGHWLEKSRQLLSFSEFPDIVEQVQCANGRQIQG